MYKRQTTTEMTGHRESKHRISVRRATEPHGLVRRQMLNMDEFIS